jgi:hypothetical protein
MLEGQHDQLAGRRALVDGMDFRLKAPLSPTVHWRGANTNPKPGAALQVLGLFAFR